MVRWLAPRLLIRSAAEVLISGLFGKFADKREIQSWPQPVYEHADRNVTWVDYTCDLGDGFDSTYSIAWLMAQDELAPDGLAGGGRLPRADALVLGGDQVYPSAGREAYENRFTGPYRAALPRSEPEAGAPWLYAIPGNHDWYDGLTSFLRLFCQGRWIGGRRTRQTRSYFALRLPEPWWVWAVDIQFDTEIDALQLSYFRAVGEQMSAGDRLLLMTAKPSWVAAEREQHSYRNLAYIEREVVPEGVDLVATLSGDLHHYSHYRLASGPQVPPSVPEHRITAGGGGAYTSATHTLRERVELPREPWDTSPGRAEDAYERGDAVYPSDAVSRRLSLGAVLAPLRTPSFAALLEAVYLLLALAMLGALVAQDGPLALRVDGAGWWGLLADSVGAASVAVTAVVVGALAAYADFPGVVARVGVGAAHAALHVAVAVTALWAATRPLSATAPDASVWLAALGGVAVAGGVGGPLLFGLYLFTVHRLRGRLAPRHTNEAFAGQASTGHKCFLRMRIERGGPVTVHAIGIDRSCRDWVPGAGSGPLLDPAPGREPAPRLVEAPYRLGG